MNFTHPLSRYGLAYVMFREETLATPSQITKEMLIKHLSDGLNHFRTQPVTMHPDPDIDTFVQYRYMPMQYILDNNQKGNPKGGIYLCPNIITSDEKAHNCWNGVRGLLALLESVKANEELLTKTTKITMSLAPVAGEVNNGKRNKENVTGTLLEASCCAIATLTPWKPSLSAELKPTCIIPDLSADDENQLMDLREFISFFQQMYNDNYDGWMKAAIYKPASGSKKKADNLFKRPKLFQGNFPFAPPNSAFGSVGLLASIGRWAYESGQTTRGRKVLESLKGVPMYLISYGNASAVTFDHFVIDLAIDNKLDKIIYALYRSKIHSEDMRTYDNPKYQLFDMLANRFLRQFDRPSFADFQSTRAEYQPEVLPLFNTFFLNKMNINAPVPQPVVDSVRELGLWLNSVAYFSAVGKVGDKSKKEDIRKEKAKTLIELESSIFSARSPAELMKVIVQAGRLASTIVPAKNDTVKYKVSMDAPASADAYLSAVLTGEIPRLEDAKMMLMAFARVRNRIEAKETPDEPTPISDERPVERTSIAD